MSWVQRLLSPPGGLRTWALPLLWAAFAVLMMRDYHSDPHDPGLTGTDAYGHNHDGALLQGLLYITIELVASLLIIRPWSYQRSWKRATLALAVAVPWTLVSIAMMMHAGGVIALHGLWMLALTSIFTVLATAGAIAALVERGNDE